MVGEQFEGVPSGEVLGLVMSLKYNNDTISVWHRTATDSKVIDQLRSSITKLVTMEEGMQLEHEIFQEVLNAPKERKVYDGSNQQ